MIRFEHKRLQRTARCKHDPLCEPECACYREWTSSERRAGQTLQRLDERDGDLRELHCTCFGVLCVTPHRLHQRPRRRLELRILDPQAHKRPTIAPNSSASLTSPSLF